MGLRGIPRHGLRADTQPRTASDGLSQALRSSAPPCAGRGRDRGFLKKPPLAPGRDRGRKERHAGAYRDLVYQRSAHRPEEQNHAAVGEARDAAFGALGPAHRLDLYLRRHLPVLLLDQAGWHLSGRLVVPENITLLPLPPKCPELNPVENIWQYLRDNWISNRVFQSYDDILDHCCYA